MGRRVEAFLIKAALLIAVLAAACVITRAQGTPVALRGQVNDEDGHPVERAEVAAKWNLNHSFTVYTDAAGQFQIAPIGDQVTISISKPGFFEIKDQNLTLTPGVNETTFTLNHATELQQQVNVVSPPSQIDPDTTSHQETLIQ